jgi:uncharacterized membrane protein YccF (DUF307 family)
VSFLCSKEWSLLFNLAQEHDVMSEKILDWLLQTGTRILVVWLLASLVAMVLTDRHPLSTLSFHAVSAAFAAWGLSVVLLGLYTTLPKNEAR